MSANTPESRSPDIRVGQLWRNRRGERVEIIAVGPTTAAWRFPDGEVAAWRSWFPHEYFTLVVDE